jgi:hypothetical protein
VIGRTVAIKIPGDVLSGDPGFERFKAEVRAVLVNHEGIAIEMSSTIRASEEGSAYLVRCGTGGAGQKPCGLPNQRNFVSWWFH